MRPAQKIQDLMYSVDFLSILTNKYMISNEIRYWRSVTVKPKFPPNTVWESLLSVDDWKYLQNKLRLHSFEM